MTGASFKNSVAVSVARSWIRYAPTLFGKEQLWRFVHWRDHRYKARTRHGFRVRGHSNDLVQGYLYYFGTWEPNLTAWLSSRFERMEGAVFLDVGANVGYYSLLAHRLMPATSSVVAIEASPLIHGMLADNIRLNGYERIRTVNCAAAAEPGSLTIYHASDSNLGGSTTNAGVWEGDGVRVSALPLSEILSNDEVARLMLVKVDVEGAEWPVLQGLSPLLPHLHPDVEFVIEICEGNAAQIFNQFKAHGFNAYGLPNLYSYKCYLAPPPIARPKRLDCLPAAHGDVIFSRRDAVEL